MINLPQRTMLILSVLIFPQMIIGCSEDDIELTNDFNTVEEAIARIIHTEGTKKEKNFHCPMVSCLFQARQRLDVERHLHSNKHFSTTVVCQHCTRFIAYDSERKTHHGTGQCAK